MTLILLVYVSDNRLRAFSASRPLFKIHLQSIIRSKSESSMSSSLSLGEYTVTLPKPLGIILEERDSDKDGVQVSSLAPGGAADQQGSIVPGDVLVQINENSVQNSDFDSIMDLLIDATSPVPLIMSDGLGTMDIAPNLAKRMETSDLFLVDKVVRMAARTIRQMENSQLGFLRSVEVIIGAGVSKDAKSGRKRCMVRFFAIFSTDTVSTFSCSVAATGVEIEDKNDDSVEIISLSCAKDEGWGQTVDLIVEKKE